MKKKEIIQRLGDGTLDIGVSGLDLLKESDKNLQNKINFQKVSIRFFSNMITVLLGGIPLVFMYFSKNNLSLSDYLSKTSYKKI